MKIVILESPYAGDVERNIEYARRAMLDSLMRGEAPMASHLLYTQVLDDNIPDDRTMGIEAGLAWRDASEGTVVYTNHGISTGMQYGIDRAKAAGKPIEYRRISEAL